MLYDYRKFKSVKEGKDPRSNTCAHYYLGNQPVNFPESGHLLAPWVAIDFTDSTGAGSSGSSITVSNRSSESTDPQNCAVIKSFELGHSDGTCARITIHDTQGGSFQEFMKHLVKDWSCLKDVNPATLLMRVQFGWVKEGCGMSLPMVASPTYYIMCDSVETNYTEGKFIFEITGRDICHRMLEGAVELQLGGEGEKSVHLLHAVHELMCDSVAPNIGKVTFRTIHGTTVVTSTTTSSSNSELFKADTIEERKLGPKGKWDAKGQNKLEAIRRWIDDCPSIEGRMWLPQYNSTEPEGELIFWENSKPDKNESDAYWESSCIGSYIVNGGPSSPVIEFNPKIRWDFGTVTAVGGQTGDGQLNPFGTEGAKNPGTEAMPREKLKGAGHVQQTMPSDSMKDRFGNQAVTEAAHNDAVSKKTITLTPGNIAADLVIIGDPIFCPPFEALNIKNITIVMINPFYLTSQNNCEWLSTPQCNAVLSNKGWIIKSVTHKIDSGVYTTTIGVELSAPGINLPSEESFGGWAGGWKPGGVC